MTEQEFRDKYLQQWPSPNQVPDLSLLAQLRNEHKVGPDGFSPAILIVSRIAYRRGLIDVDIREAFHLDGKDRRIKWIVMEEDVVRLHGFRWLPTFVHSWPHPRNYIEGHLRARHCIFTDLDKALGCLDWSKGVH